MKSIFNTLVKNLHFLIILKTGMGVYSNFEAHNEQYENLVNETKSIEDNIKGTIKKNKEAVEFEKDLEKSKAKVLEVAKNIETVQRQLPNSIEDTEILDFFSREAELVNVKELQLSPLNEENRGFYFSKSFQVKGIGTFLQFLIFFERMSGHSRLMNVRSMKLSHSEVKQKGRFQIIGLNAVMEVFRYNKDYKEKTGLENERG